MPTSPPLSALSRPVATTLIPHPPSRLLMRAFVPASVLLAALALLAYAARESFRPAISVQVAPAVPRAGGSTNTEAAEPGEIVQAPGWIEPDPSAIGVPALAGGVLKELLVLDGERVEKGQVIAALNDEEATLALRRATAELTKSAAAIAESRATVAVEEARAEEARELLARVEHLTGTGTIPEGDIVNRRLKLASQVASVAAARAAVARAESEEQIARVGVAEAELAVSRMTVHAPASGVVLQRLVEPGQRLMLDANNPYAGVVLRLYDPGHVQVRVDVPLADAAKVRSGDVAEITTETLPGRTFTGTLTRFVHEANLQKNTVQVKVSITDPAPELKPDMLAKARISTRPSKPTDAAAAASAQSSEGVLVIPHAALLEVSGSQGAAWVLDRQTSTAVKRTLHLGRVNPESADVLDGLRPGDRVILNPPTTLREGSRVQPGGEKEAR
jgi:HlyD family secretion protein